VSSLEGKVGSWDIRWKSAPHGLKGSARVVVNGEELELRWSRDSHGLWIEFPGGVHGFDLRGERDEDRGLHFRISERQGPGEWAGVAFARAGTEALAGAGSKKKGMRVRAQMPGKIVRVLVKTGDEVAKDQPLLVMEAMKMENEIRAPSAGKVEKLAVAEGQAVESGADLVSLA
jgi:biotin carboxyl carrier protein